MTPKQVNNLKPGDSVLWMDPEKEWINNKSGVLEISEISIEKSLATIISDKNESFSCKVKDLVALPIEPESLTIEHVEASANLPADMWHGKCHMIAWAAVRLLEGATAPYGHYLGPVDADGYWGGRRGLPIAHGWVLLDDERVLDPTRFSFENVDPYLFISNDVSEYDEGGNAFRSAIMKPCPRSEDGKLANLQNLESYEILALETVLKTKFDKITNEQMFWAANASYDFLGVFVHPVYSALGKNNMKIFVPWDNWQRAVRERGLPESFEEEEEEVA